MSLPRESRILLERIIDKAIDQGRKKLVVAYPCSDVALGGAIEAVQSDLVDVILVGPESVIKDVAKKNHMEISCMEIVNTEDSEDAAAAKAVEICKSGTGEILMKGSLHTDVFMKAIVNKEHGLRTDLRLSHVFVCEVPVYHKLLLITDGAVNIAPDLETKVSIAKNAIQTARALGVEKPRAAVISAIEYVNPKMQSSVDADELKKRIEAEDKDVYIEGPLAMDNIISKKAARLKGIESVVSGDVDIIITPNIEAGNMLSKAMAYLAGGEVAGVLCGAAVPVVLTSRADGVMARLSAVATASLIAGYKG